MDNAVQALFMAFAVIALAIGLSFSLYLIGNMSNVSKKLIQSQDATRDYQSVSYNSNDRTVYRKVGVDTVISTLYKYYKESFSVEIYNKNKDLVQIFDLTIENVLAGNNQQVSEWNAYNELYSENNLRDNHVNLFGSPWIGNTEYIKQRIDMYISGQTAYINGILVDYSGDNSLKELIKNGDTFEEQFIQYAYEGQTISDNLGGDIESITGSVRAKNKIIIRYIQQ